MGKTSERPILFSAPMVRAILAGQKTQTRRILKPQPPSIGAVRKMSGDGFSIFTDHHAEPDEFRVAGPAWAVRDPTDREPQWRCPYGKPGDRLWVRETWYCDHFFVGDFEKTRNGYVGRTMTDAECIAEWSAPSMMYYRADGEATQQFEQIEHPTGRIWRPSIFMPRWASRLTLEVTAVRVERLNEITEGDAEAEGVKPGTRPAPSTYPPRRTEHQYRVPETHAEAYARLWDEINGKRAPWLSNPWVWVIEFRAEGLIEPQGMGPAATEE